MDLQPIKVEDTIDIGLKAYSSPANRIEGKSTELIEEPGIILPLWKALGQRSHSKRSPPSPHILQRSSLSLVENFLPFDRETDSSCSETPFEV